MRSLKGFSNPKEQSGCVLEVGHTSAELLPGSALLLVGVDAFFHAGDGGTLCLHDVFHHPVCIHPGIRDSGDHDV